PWEYAAFWKVRDSADRGRKTFPADWENLQRPGFSPDYTQRREWHLTTDGERADWGPTAAAPALVRNNQPLRAYVGGKPESFTSRDHTFRPGETLDKQLVIVNNSREAVACECAWSLGLPQPAGGSKPVSVPAGGQERILLRFDLPGALAAGSY